MSPITVILGFLAVIGACCLLSWGTWAWLGWWGLVPVGLFSIVTIGYAGFLLILFLSQGNPRLAVGGIGSNPLS